MICNLQLRAGNIGSVAECVAHERTPLPEPYKKRNLL